MSRWKPKTTFAESDTVLCPQCGTQEIDLTEDLSTTDDDLDEAREVHCQECGAEYTVQIVIERTFTMEVV